MARPSSPRKYAPYVYLRRISDIECTFHVLISHESGKKIVRDTDNSPPEIKWGWDGFIYLANYKVVSNQGAPAGDFKDSQQITIPPSASGKSICKLKVFVTGGTPSILRTIFSCDDEDKNSVLVEDKEAKNAPYVYLTKPSANNPNLEYFPFVRLILKDFKVEKDIFTNNGNLNQNSSVSIVANNGILTIFDPTTVNNVAFTVLNEEGKLTTEVFDSNQQLKAKTIIRNKNADIMPLRRAKKK